MASRIASQLIFTILGFLLVLLPAWPGLNAGPVSSNDPEILKREQMVEISRQLGVTCTHCHDVKDFRDGKKKEFQTALQHIRITEMLNKEAFVGEASCFMCHRGHAKFEFKEGAAKK